MVKETVYGGTKNMSAEFAVKRIKELYDKNKSSIGSKDQEFFEEALGLLGIELPKIVKDSNSFNIVRPKLTPKQWEMIYDGE